MSSIVLVDSSILLNILDVPMRSQHKDEVLNRLEELIENEDHLFIPMAAIVEVGNHISHVADGGLRRKAAERFVKELRAAIGNEAPWKPINFPATQELAGWLDEFVESATQGISFGDLTIAHEWTNYCSRFAMSHVWVWTLDGGLADCDRPASP